MLTNSDWFTNPDKITLVILTCVILLQFAWILKVSEERGRAKALASKQMVENSELQRKISGLENAKDDGHTALVKKFNCYSACITSIDSAMETLDNDLAKVNDKDKK